MACGITVGDGIGCFYAKLCDGRLARHHSFGCPPDNDYNLAVVLPRIVGNGCSNSHSHKPFMGQKDYAAVKRNAYDGWRINIMLSLLLGIPVVLFRDQMGGLFTDNVEVQQYVSVLIILLMVYQFGDGLQYSFANALRGIACVKPMVTYAFIAYFVISLPMGYTLGFPCGLDIIGIWLAFPVGLTIAGYLFWRRFIKEVDILEANKTANAAVR